MTSLIANYQNDNEFRDYVPRYLTAFKQLLDEAKYGLADEERAAKMDQKLRAEAQELLDRLEAVLSADYLHYLHQTLRRFGTAAGDAQA